MADPRNGARKARLVQEAGAGGTVEAVVLEDGRWVDVVALKQAVTGGDWPPSSRQLRELELVGFGEGIIEPPFNLSLLYDWLYVSSVHGACVSQKVIDIVEIGHRLIGNPVLPDGVTPDAAQKARLEGFIGDPNDQEETLLEILSKTVTDFEAVGNGYLEVVRGPETANQPLAVYHMASPTVRVRRDRQKKLGFVQIRGGRRRYFKAYGDDRAIDNQTGEVLAGAQIPIERQASEVIHFKMYTHLSEFYGAPTWLSSLSAMLGDMKARDYNIEFFDNKAVPAYAVVAQGGRLTDDSKEMLRQFFAHELKGKHHRTVVLDAVPGKDGAQVSVTFEKLAVDIKDASFRLFRQDNAEEILIAHKMPPYRVGWARTGSLGGATAVEMTQIYKESVIEPRQNRFEARLDKLFGDVLQVTDWLFRFNDIDARDEVQEATLARQYMEIGALSTNEILEKLGLPPVEGGDVKFIWLNAGNPIPVSRLPELAAREDLLPSAPALPPEDGGGLGLGNLRGLADLVQKRAPLRRARERLVKQFIDRVLPLMVAKAEAFIETLPEGRLVAVAEVLGAPHAQEKRQATTEKQARPLTLSQRRVLENLFRDIDKTYDFDDIGLVTEAFMRRVANWAGTAAYSQLGVSGLAFDLKNPAIAATLKQLAGEHIGDIRATAKQDLQDLLVEMFFEEGKNPLDIARGIRKNLGDQIRETYRHRSETIARTETGIAQEVTQDEVFRRAGVQTYTWITAGDDKVRPSHRALHGVTIKVGERFANGLRFPLDPQGRAEEVIQCRCDFLPGFEDLPIPEDQMWDGS